MWDLEVHRLGGTHSCFVSEAARAHALAVGVHAARMTVIRNGVDTETFRPRTDARVGELVVGYAGRLSPEKNPALFVRVAARLRAQGSPARFVVIGDGPMRGELETLSDALAVRDAITFAGECRDMPARYRALDLLLLTSLARRHAARAARSDGVRRTGGGDRRRRCRRDHRRGQHRLPRTARRRIAPHRARVDAAAGSGDAGSVWPCRAPAHARALLHRRAGAAHVGAAARDCARCAAREATHRFVPRSHATAANRRRRAELSRTGSDSNSGGAT